MPPAGRSRYGINGVRILRETPAAGKRSVVQAERQRLRHPLPYHLDLNPVTPAI